LKYGEGDADGGVDNNIFDTVALPDLPVDNHHHDHLTIPPPQNAPNEQSEVSAADVPINAAVPDPTHEVADGEVGVASGHSTEVRDLGGTLPHDGQQPGDEGLDLERYPPLLPNAVVRLMPMPEAIIPAKWLNRYEELKRYKEEHGDFNVPMCHDQRRQLSAWIRTQKHQYKLLHEGKPNHMSQARIDLLNEIGFEWAGERRDKFWHDRYAELVSFRAKHGTTRIPDKYDESPQLHTWVSLQRRQLKMYKEGRPTKLTEERIRLLEAMGLESNIRNSSTWMDRFMELKRYKDEHGDCNVPQKWKENVSLGRWVDNQKTQHQKLYDGKPTHLTIERIQLLVSIGFNWRRK